MSPFYLNDIFLIESRTAEGWLTIDYASRCISLVLLLSVGTRLRDLVAENRIASWGRFVLATIVATLIGYALSTPLGNVLRVYFLDLDLAAFPGYSSAVQRGYDLTLGIAFVAISEEVIFRWYLDRELKTAIASDLVRLLVGALLFALAHWSRLTIGLIETFLVGMAYIWLYRKFGTIWPLVIAHYFVDLLVFSGWLR